MSETERRDDPVEGGALDDEGEGDRLPDPGHDEPVESGALEKDES